MLNLSSLSYPYDSHETLKNLRLLKQALSENAEGYLPVRIAIFSESTIAPIKDFLELFLLKRGIKPAFYLSAYGKVKQDLLDKSSELSEFNPQVSVLYSTSNDFGSFPEVSAGHSEADALVENKISEIKALWQGINSQTQSAIIQNNFEYLHLRPLGNLEAVHSAGKTYFIRAVNSALAAEAKKSSVHLHDLNYLSSLVGLDAWWDRRLWHLYKYPSSVESFSFIAESLSSMISSLLGQAKKILIVDADNTLWGGTLDESGPEGVKIGKADAEAESFYEFQTYLKELSHKGIALGLISKNDPENVKSALKRTDNSLTAADFSSIKANWSNKDINMAEMLSELQLKPGAAVFVDDNPFERSLIKKSIKDVAVPDVGEDVTAYAVTLDRNYFFETSAVSQEDVNRKTMFAADASRARLQKEFTSYGDFLKQLQMKVTFSALNEPQLERAVQLINKTNQFNLTHAKTGSAELKKQLAADHFGLGVFLSDKFGDMGLISVVVARKNSHVAEIEHWVMSCRVIGRKVEDEVFTEFVNSCKEAGIQEITGVFSKTGKNDLVKDLYAKLGFKKVSSGESKEMWSLPVQEYSAASSDLFEKVRREQ